MRRERGSDLHTDRISWPSAQLLNWMLGRYSQKSRYSLHGGMFQADRPSLQIANDESKMKGPMGVLTINSSGVDCDSAGRHGREQGAVV